MFYRFARFVVWVIFSVLFRIRVTGHENVPVTGGMIVCANHVDSRDPVFIAISLKRSLRFMAKKELFQNKALGWLLRNLGAFSVDRSAADMSTYKTALKVLQAGEAVLIFSQGTRMQELDVKNAKSGVALFAVKSKVPVVPVGITSTFKLFAPVHIRIGEPVTMEKYEGVKLRTEQLNEITEEIMERVKSLVGDER